MPISNQDIQEKAQELLQNEAFQNTEETESFLWQFLTQFNTLTEKFWPSHTATTDDSSTLIGLFFKGTIGLIILVASSILFITIGVLVYRHLIVSKKQTKSNSFLISQQEREEHRQSYMQQAMEARGKSDFRKAIHFLFLATVTVVIQDQHFKATSVMTNREIVTAVSFKQFKDAPRLKQLFESMVFFDEPRWFGHQDASLSDYESYLEQCMLFHQLAEVRYA